MKVCPSCGDVYPDRTTSCPSDRTVLQPWGAAPSELDLGRYTDVDLPSFQLGGPILEPARAVAGEVELDDAAERSEAPVSGDTPRVRVSRAVARSTPPGRGRVLGNRYRLGRQLGIGGYGAVFAAEDLHGGAPVAIKILSPAVEQSGELLTRFHREAIAASRIRHPSIVEVLDFDVDDDGAQYIVMEFLDGRDLAERLEEVGRLPPARALAIAAQCASGLAAAHRVGVLHRDLKPPNVFLIGEPGAEQVKVIDFGISKLTRVAGDYTDVTSTSKVVGTPLYMPPEQARGEELDGRADVYALGVMLFEMLTGQRPFGGRSPLELFAQHVRAPRRPPSALVPELAAIAGLDALVVTALAAERSHRFATMDQFADALVACLRTIDPGVADELAACSGELTAATTATVPPRRARLARVIRPALAALALTAGVVAALISARTAPVPPPPAAPAPATPVEHVAAPAPGVPVAARPDAAVELAPAVEPEPEVAPAPAPTAAPPPPRPARPARPRPARTGASQLGVAEW